MKNPKTKNWQNGNQQVNPGSGDEWARIKPFRNPTTGKVMSDFEGAIGSAPGGNASLGTKVNKQPKGLVGDSND